MPTMLEMALSYQQHGFAVYPLAPGTRTPLKGSHGYKDATTDPKQAEAWWGEHPDCNIGLGLDGMLVFDIDMGHKSAADGNESLAKLSADGRAGQIPSTYIETTPNGGLHMFFTYPKNIKLTSRADLFSKSGEKTGLDYTALGVPVYPSMRDSGMYKPLKGHKLTTVAPAPQWLLDEINRYRGPVVGSYRTDPDSWFGNFINRLVDGSDEGNRNQWLASIAGSVFRSGADPDNCADLIQTINQRYVRPPLPNGELVKIIKSISKREIARRS
ncbi:bifunctional DNA primase/polymerase [Lacticaseibacillus hegangensis]|uniref:Bifunctional DNA primase/polymerase n=1 Tax=Lacticaseibacillus hegangensis TaxID=2486010 RepID=A0ABW4CSZ7_9LACO|nr:bifunctional DNA primase/polymerase [Lacticaseibacillus hegangensis]